MRIAPKDKDKDKDKEKEKEKEKENVKATRRSVRSLRPAVRDEAKISRKGNILAERSHWNYCKGNQRDGYQNIGGACALVISSPSVKSFAGLLAWLRIYS